MTVDARVRAAYLAYRAGAELARVVPPAVGGLVADGLARTIRRASPARRAQVVRNLRRVTRGQLAGSALDRAVDEVFTNYARYWYEFFRLPAASPEWIRRTAEVDGLENIDAALSVGRGAIVALPHLGNWDMAGARVAASGVDLVAVAETLEPPALFEWFAAARRRIGIDVIALGAGSASAIAGALAANRVVCLLSDRDLAGTGVEVEFFGERTTIPGGPALLALRTGAALLPSAAYFTGGRHLARIGAPITVRREQGLRADVERVTATLVAHMEDAIREAPEQWLLMQPNWPSDRSDGGAHGDVSRPT
jgi:lauroyl/myristoyl acyltransferase